MKTAIYDEEEEIHESQNQNNLVLIQQANLHNCDTNTEYYKFSRTDRASSSASSASIRSKLIFAILKYVLDKLYPCFDTFQQSRGTSTSP